MEFGFVPSQVVKELEEIGNWKVGPSWILIASFHDELSDTLPPSQAIHIYNT